jgi:hypothetical protein
VSATLLLQEISRLLSTGLTGVDEEEVMKEFQALEEAEGLVEPQTTPDRTPVEPEPVEVRIPGKGAQRAREALNKGRVLPAAETRQSCRDPYRTARASRGSHNTDQGPRAARTRGRAGEKASRPLVQ